MTPRDQELWTDAVRFVDGMRDQPEVRWFLLCLLSQVEVLNAVVKDKLEKLTKRVAELEEKA